VPTKSSARWIADGNNMVKVFKEKPATQTDLQYAEDDIPNQLAQIENMVTKGVKVLVIAAIDGTTLSDVLQKAADAGIKVIAYDRLIRNSGNVDYYATFDNFQVGVLQANVRSSGAQGSPARALSTSNCSAARLTTTTPSSSTTAPCRSCSRYIDDKLVVRSSPARPAWTRSARCVGTAATAQARMDNLLSANYGRPASMRSVAL
jgi:putative multiple sugar transport system substrate-binding protein